MKNSKKLYVIIAVVTVTALGIVFFLIQQSSDDVDVVREGDEYFLREMGVLDNVLPKDRKVNSQSFEEEIAVLDELGLQKPQQTFESEISLLEELLNNN